MIQSDTHIQYTTISQWVTKGDSIHGFEQRAIHLLRNTIFVVSSTPFAGRQPISLSKLSLIPIAPQWALYAHHFQLRIYGFHNRSWE
jgi:hypothetical protein